MARMLYETPPLNEAVVEVTRGVPTDRGIRNRTDWRLPHLRGKRDEEELKTPLTNPLRGMNKLYVVYDQRAAFEGTDDASVLLATNWKSEAFATAEEEDGVVAEYDLKKREGQPDLAVNERILNYPS